MGKTEQEIAASAAATDESKGATEVQLNEDGEDLLSSLAGYPVNPIKEDTNPDPLKKEITTVEEPETVIEDDEEPESSANDLTVNVRDLPEHIQDYIIASTEEGFDPATYYSESKRKDELLSLSPKEFYAAYLKASHLKTESNPNGVLESEADVTRELDRLSPLELKLKVDQMKEELSGYYDKKRQERLDKLPEARSFDKEGYTQSIEDTIIRNQGTTEFFGFQFNEVEKKEVDEAFRMYTEINPETGRALMHDLIEDDDMLYKVIALIHKGEGAFKSKINERVESVKQKIFDKLGLEPTDTGGGTTPGMPTKLDPNVFV